MSIELLKAAADAIGLQYEWHHGCGDALRLAVRLRNDITFNDALAMAWCSNGADGESEPLDPDHYAATRRAIVRAAAAMPATSAGGAA